MALIRAMWRATPWAGVGLAVTVVLALIAARPLGRRMHTSVVGTFFWLLALGGVLTLTATPGLSNFTAHSCSLALAGPVSPGELFALKEESLNVWMFVPITFLSALPRQRRTLRLAVGVAVALPFFLEALQWAVPAMGRACQSQDIVNNLMGVVIGLAIGALARVAFSRWRSRSGGPSEARV